MIFPSGYEYIAILQICTKIVLYLEQLKITQYTNSTINMGVATKIIWGVGYILGEGIIWKMKGVSIFNVIVENWWGGAASEKFGGASPPP